MKKIIILLFTVLLSLNNLAYWEENIENKDIKEYITNYNINYEDTVLVNKKIKIDLKNLRQSLEINYEWKEFLFLWEIWDEKIKSEMLEYTYKNKWEKNINLKIKTKYDDKEEIIYDKELKIFIYEDIIPFIFSSKLENKSIEEFIDIWRKSWIYIYNIWKFTKWNINSLNIIEHINTIRNLWGNSSNYFVVWWEKDFLFDTTSQINKELSIIKSNSKISLLLLSSYNIDIIEKYISNFISNKIWIDKIILTSEASKTKIITSQSLDISILKKELKESWYEFNDISDIEKWANYDIMFLSKFINNMSNAGFDSTSIYIIIIFPLILAFISFIKHMIGFSPTGIIIPLFLTILMIKLWFIVWIWLFISFFIFNIIISYLTNKSTLLYTPKISFILSLNIVFLVIVLNAFYKYEILSVDINTVLFFVLFLIINEKLISVIISKEFAEYSNAILNTLIISIILFSIFNINYIKVFILSFPEIILIFIPITFLIWKFTWLRVTEYFRFREVIKSIEE